MQKMKNAEETQRFLIAYLQRIKKKPISPFEKSCLLVQKCQHLLDNDIPLSWNNIRFILHHTNNWLPTYWLMVNQFAQKSGTDIPEDIKKLINF